MKEMVKTYFKDFYISPQVAYITGVVIKIDWMEEKYEERKDETKEDVNMCLAMDEWEKEAMANGEIRGEAKGKAEGISEERHRIVLFMHTNGSTAEQIAKTLGIDEQEVKDILSVHRA